MDEIEIRAVVEQPEAIQEKLRGEGFEEEDGFQQHDIIIDKPDASLFRSGQKIRIRVEKRTAEITYKGLFTGDPSASRRLEINIRVEPEDVTKFVALFEAMGYPVCFEIWKWRKVFRRGNLAVSFDNWPIIGCLMEIEGQEQDARLVAKRAAPDIEFRNFRLKELFAVVERKTGRSLAQLKEEYERASGVSLGHIELLAH
jgi:predicted adenylyl cyclase CyaB